MNTLLQHISGLITSYHYATTGEITAQMGEVKAQSRPIIVEVDYLPACDAQWAYTHYPQRASNEDMA